MRRRHHSRFPFFLFFALLFTAGWVFLFSALADQLGTSSRRDQELALQSSLEHAITSCYALEGMYPPDLSYMKEHYGLVYDEDLFYVTYRPVAANIRPEYFILEKDEKTDSAPFLSDASGKELP